MHVWTGWMLPVTFNFTDTTESPISYRYLLTTANKPMRFPTFLHVRIILYSHSETNPYNDLML